MLRRWRLSGETAVEAGDGPIWVFSSPDEAERRRLVEEIGLDAHTLSSALDPDELARVEHEPDHLAVILKRPRSWTEQGGRMFRVASAGLFLFPDKLVVVTDEDVPIVQGPSFAPRGGAPSDGLLRIAHRTVYRFLEHLRVIGAVSDEVEGRIATSLENRQLLDLFRLEKSLVHYQSALDGNAAALERLKASAGKFGLAPEQVDLLDDIAIENRQCLHQADIASSVLASLMDARASIVNNNLAALVKTLNIITLVIMAPTLVVSIFSMNVAIPMQGWPGAFWAILGLAGAASAGFVAAWRYRRW